MPKIFNKEENAAYYREIAKLATAQVQLNAEKYRFQALEADLKKDRYLFFVTLFLGIVAICATVWSALK